MTKRPGVLALTTSLALIGACAIAVGAEQRKSYKWVDANGVTHYGDTVPPEFASQGRAELNNQGVAVREVPRQLSPAEAAEAQKKAGEEARRRQHDTFLLTTYTKVADIEQLRDERISLIDSQLEITRGSMNSSDQRIQQLQQRMLRFRPYSVAATAPRMPDKLAEEVVRALSERRSMQAGMESREKEKAELRAQFDADIARYRELTTRPSR